MSNLIEEFNSNNPPEIPERICIVCGNIFNHDWRKDTYLKRTTTPLFCSRKCSNSYSSQKSKGKTKIIVCPECKEEYVTNVHTPLNTKCPLCRRKFRYPEDTFIGKFERSGVYTQKSINLERLGFNFNNPSLEEEYLKIQKLLVTEYEINLKSADLIEREYGLSQGSLTIHMLENFGIKKRTASSALSLSFYQNEKNISENEKNAIYKTEHHIDWEGKIHFLRSSYESDLAEKLDEKRIRYETESIRIRYFDSQLGIYKTGVPDFYLPKYNLIIETKSKYFYDDKNLNDRKVELESLGFKFYVYLDKEKLLSEFPEINEIKNWETLDSIFL